MGEAIRSAGPIGAPVETGDHLTATYQILSVLCEQPSGATLFLCDDRTTGEQVVAKQAAKTNYDEHTVVTLEPHPDHTPLIVTLSQDSIDQESRVAQLLRISPHANVVHFLPTSRSRPTGTLIMEYCPGGDLFSLLEQQPTLCFTEYEALRLFREIVSGVQHLHLLDVAHRDLSLENVLLDVHGHAKICDFGLSTRASVAARECAGKLQYMAPEVVSGTSSYDPIVPDVWSLGIMLFIMLTGSPLFAFAVPSDTAWAALQRVGIAGILTKWQLRDQISDATIELLRDMLRIDPARRLQSVADVRRLLG